MHIILIQQNIIHHGKHKIKTERITTRRKEKHKIKTERIRTQRKQSKSKQNEEQQIPF